MAKRARDPLSMYPDMTPEEREAVRERRRAHAAEERDRIKAYAAAHPVSAEERAHLRKITGGLVS